MALTVAQMSHVRTKPSDRDPWMIQSSVDRNKLPRVCAPLFIRSSIEYDSPKHDNRSNKRRICHASTVRYARWMSPVDSCTLLSSLVAQRRFDTSIRVDERRKSSRLHPRHRALCIRMTTTQVSMPNSPVNVVNVNRWITDNQTDFVPPVCNKLMSARFLVSGRD